MFPNCCTPRTSALAIVALPAAGSLGLLLALRAALLAPGAQPGALVRAAGELSRCLLLLAVAALLGGNADL